MSTLDSLSSALAGRYRIERELGRGGMATVYLARDLRHDREVAVKILHPELASQVSAERFLREIELVAQLTHPQILPLLDSGRLDDKDGFEGQPYYVMPFVPGETLRARIARETRLSVEIAQQITHEIADALDFAHKRGVVHRDIKPENILLLEGHAMVSDFGIARALNATSDRMTVTGTLIGTPAYMSPEQAVGAEGIDGRSDQYSLACVLYEMLTGSPPFAGTTAQALIGRHVMDTPLPVRSVRPDISPTFDAAIQRAMSKAPADRFATTMDFARAVRADAFDARRDRRRSGVWAALGMALVAVLVMAYRASDARRHTTPTVTAANATRIAVLPLRSVSPDSSDRYFADGMTDELIGTLASIGELKVIARSSVAAYADTGHRSTADLARLLNVGSVLEGSVRKSGERLRISIALSDAATGESRWSHTYDQTLTDVFAVQRDVALAVANALKVTLLAREASQVSKRPPRSAAAYEAYLRASVIVAERFTGPTFRLALDTAITLLHGSLAQDSSFAPAWAMLAQAYSQLMFNFGAPRAYRDSASVAIARALALDTTLAEAYRARSNLAYTREAGWQLEQSLQDILRAVALKPGGADEHATFSLLLVHLGFLAEAQREFATTFALDPTNETVRYRVPRVMWQRQQFAEALATYQRDRQNGWRTSLAEEGLVLGYLGRAADGLRLLADTVGGLGYQREDEEAAAGVLLARLGRFAEAKAKLSLAERLGASRSHFHHAAFAIATAHAIMGEKAAALRWLERTASDGMPEYELFANDPALVPLRGTPEFEAFMSRQRVTHARYADILERARR